MILVVGSPSTNESARSSRRYLPGIVVWYPSGLQTVTWPPAFASLPPLLEAYVAPHVNDVVGASPLRLNLTEQVTPTLALRLIPILKPRPYAGAELAAEP